MCEMSSVVYAPIVVIVVVVVGRVSVIMCRVRLYFCAEGGGNGSTAIDVHMSTQKYTYAYTHKSKNRTYRLVEAQPVVDGDAEEGHS